MVETPIIPKTPICSSKQSIYLVRALITHWIRHFAVRIGPVYEQKFMPFTLGHFNIFLSEEVNVCLPYL